MDKKYFIFDYELHHLRVLGLAENEYLCLFGQYILTPGIFDCLQYHIEHNLRERNEIQLTSSLEMLRQQEGYYAYETQGNRYDIGVPEGYVETITALAEKSNLNKIRISNVEYRNNQAKRKNKFKTKNQKT